MGITISQYRAAIGLWNRPTAPSKKAYETGTSESLHCGQIDLLVSLTHIICIVCIVLSNCKATDLGLGATLMSRQCLQALLAISGVEQNPGPVSLESQKKAIDELCSKAPSDKIKDILKAYHPQESETRQRNAIKQFKREELILALEFLKLTNQGKYTKPQLVHNSIVRI